MNETPILPLLQLGMHPAWCKVDAHQLESLSRKFSASLRRERDPFELDHQLSVFLVRSIEAEVETIHALRRSLADFLRRHERAFLPEDRRTQVLLFAQELGANEKQLVGDRSAFARWFDAEAVTDRCKRRIGAAERRLAFMLGRLGYVSAHVFGKKETTELHVLQWRHALEKLLRPLLAYAGDHRVALAAFRCLAIALRACPTALCGQQLEQATMQYIFRCATDIGQAVWIQSEAIALLQTIATDALATVLRKRLSTPREGEDMFVRRRALQVLATTVQEHPELLPLAQLAWQDPSAYVRQALAEVYVADSSGEALQWLRALLLHDKAHEVRAAALLALMQLIDRDHTQAQAFEILVETLRHEHDEFVLRTALKVASDIVLSLPVAARAERGKILLTPIENLHTDAPSLALRRWAAQTRERIWCAIDPQASALAVRLESILQKVPPGKSRRLPSEFSKVEPQLLGRVLSMLAQESYGFDIRLRARAMRITRGPVFGLRLWRFLYEWRNPSTDKRQGHPYMLGRIYSGNLRVPSSILNELSETKVPGEPLVMSDESGGRPYLPLADEVLSTLDLPLSETLRIYTSEGMTEVLPPATWRRRIRASWHLTWNFALYAALRNWTQEAAVAPQAYTQALQTLGFGFCFTPYPGTQVDSAVRRFFN